VGGLVLETILGGITAAAGGGFELFTPGDGDTFTVRDFDQNSRAYIEELWGLDTAHAAQLSLASPRMNDGQEGLRLAIPSGAVVLPPEEPQNIFPGPGRMPIYRADTLKVQASATANDALLIAYTARYESLDGSDVAYRTWDQVGPLIEKTFGILVQPTSGVGDYGSPVTLDSVDDRLEADKSYALLGATCSIATGLISIAGPDTGRYRIGLPGKVDPVEGADYFIRMAAKYQLPYIPVIKATNKGSTLIYTAAAATAGTPNVTLVLAQLSS
jgi:hypothetical protein